MADSQKLLALPKNFQVYVGIDFGTDGTGLAYALPDGTTFVHQKWKGYKRSVEVKPKTRILLDAAGNFLAFGQPATNSYITMGGGSTGWMLFERFKMALYDQPAKDEDGDGRKGGDDLDESGKDRQTRHDIKDTLTAINGTEFPSDRVFVEALKYIKSQVFKFFTKNKLQIDRIDDIQWILTVPAIWSEKAKYKMEQWAFRAGLINKEIPNHLKIVYEPDCASLSIQYEIQKLKKKEKKLSIMKASSSRSARDKLEAIEQKTEETTESADVARAALEQKQGDQGVSVDDAGSSDGHRDDNAPDARVADENEEEEVEAPKLDGVDDAAMKEPVTREDEEVDDEKQDEDEEMKAEGDDNQSGDDAEDGGNDDDEEEENREHGDGGDGDAPQSAKEDDVSADKGDATDESPKCDDENEEADAVEAAKADDAGGDDEDHSAAQHDEDHDGDGDDGDGDEEAVGDDVAKKDAEIVDEEKENEVDDDTVSESVAKMEVDELSESARVVVDVDVDDEEKEESSQWLKGEKYILIDAGGGTCDVACHEILGDFAVQEIVHPTGGPWGSTYIDDHFIDFLFKVFQRDWMEEFKREDPAAYAELIDNFRVAKQEFWKAERGHKDNDDALEHDDDPEHDGPQMDELSEELSIEQKLKLYADKWHNVQLPFDFCTFLEEKVDDSKDEIEDCDLETVVEETEILGQKGLVMMEDEYLKMNYVIWTTQMFDLVVDPIINHCVFLLTETIMKESTKYICLVGGLGSSKYLQHRVTEKFGPSSKYGLNIIVPSRPILSVVDGAARFGLQPDYIQARTLAKTYGNAIDPKIEVVDIDALPPGYLEANQYKCDHTKALRVRNIFSVYARKNQTVHIADKPIIRKYKRFNLKQKKVRISVYSSDEQDPKVVKDKPCAKTTVVFPPNSKELSIVVELRFSDTKIRVFAYPEDDPENKKEMELDYEFQ